jgi:predicted transcriptional regulator
VAASNLDTVDTLILDLLEWVANGRKSYAEVMEVWRTSCPRLPVWEDANDRGLVATTNVDGRLVVAVTPSGRSFLEQYRKQPQQ